jgi:hypothetical protein
MWCRAHELDVFPIEAQEFRSAQTGTPQDLHDRIDTFSFKCNTGDLRPQDADRWRKVVVGSSRRSCIRRRPEEELAHLTFDRAGVPSRAAWG